MKKLLLVAAGVAGYVLGTRAGRERYEQIRTQSSKVWNSPTVQHGVDEASDVAKQAAGAAGSKVADAAQSAGSTVSEKVSERLSGSGDDAKVAGVDVDGPPAAVSDPAAPTPGSSSKPLSKDTPTSAAAPPTAGDLDPNKNL
ncbi:hypothetical protein ACHAAC_14710 [Aeromicrobium sp. CF4.19]|uniref:hypothetical protein n=1 Tax=Aeromicrobium sp. CF4.19 TaxID=3373082 RepID=UPI003EE50A54